MRKNQVMRGSIHARKPGIRKVSVRGFGRSFGEMNSGGVNLLILKDRSSPFSHFASVGKMCSEIHGNLSPSPCLTLRQTQRSPMSFARVSNVTMVLRMDVLARLIVNGM